MKIVILVGGFLPKWIGGTEIATSNIARYLAQRGHEIHVVTARDEGLGPEAEVDGFYVHRVRIIRVKYLASLSLWTMPLGLIKKIDPDVIIVQSIISGMGGYLAKRFLGRPYVVWGRGGDINSPWLFKKAISRLVLNRAAAVFALTGDMQAKMASLCDRSVVIVPNGIDVSRYSKAREMREPMRRKLGMEDTDTVLLSVGRLLPSKGLSYLLRSMPLLLQHRPGFRLVIVGDGTDREALKHLAMKLHIRHAVRFAGRVANEEIPGYMAAGDIFVFPSLSEGFPNVILEAMATGLPVVASNITALAEIVTNGENGLLVEPKSAEDIARKVIQVCASEDLRKTMSSNNMARANSYSWEKVALMVEEALKSSVTK